MIGLIVSIAVGVGAIWAHWKSRQYTRNRLRYVDVVQNPLVPLGAGAGTAIILLPVVALLPFVGPATALLFGVGVGTGVMLGAKDVKRLPG
jgi:hypothetical protein